MTFWYTAILGPSTCNTWELFSLFFVHTSCKSSVPNVLLLCLLCITSVMKFQLLTWQWMCKKHKPFGHGPNPILPELSEASSALSVIIDASSKTMVCWQLHLQTSSRKTVFNGQKKRLFPFSPSKMPCPPPLSYICLIFLNHSLLTVMPRAWDLVLFFTKVMVL